ncbi:MAG TPA: tripartite tricarboxylate transporter substrate binding protein, partial [Burkholderiales bacterium]|nr:tripartite tricarboxylate transporter substrate binding protein [Burkholderiales bacterium]
SSNVNNPNENISQWRAGQVKPLCVFSKQRMAYKDKVTAGMSWSDIPTCKESGVNVEEFRMPRMVYAHASIKPEHMAYYIGLFKKVAETAEWKAFLQSNALNGVFLSGAELSSYIASDTAMARQIYQDSGWLIK